MNIEQLTDLELVKQYCNSNNHECLTELFSRHSDILYRSALRTLRNTSDAEDIMQSAFCQMITDLHNFKGTGSVLGWMLQVVNHLCLNRFRTEKNRIKREKIVMSEKVQKVDSENNDLKETVEIHLNKLPDIYKVPITLQLIEGLSVKEVSETLEIPEKTIRQQISRGLEKLKLSLKGAGITASVVSMSEILSSTPQPLAPEIFKQSQFLNKLYFAKTSLGTKAISATAFKSSSMLSKFYLTTIPKIVSAICIAILLGLASYIFFKNYHTSSATNSANLSNIPAFPGAEGYGAESKGGRGGKIIEVTNLNDSGVGSFRAACEEKGPRIILFKIAGTIETTGITIKDPFITIAGQTTPGEGVQLKQVPGGGSIDGCLVIENTHDVIIRGLRVRPGAIGSTDALTIMNSSKIIIDRCSFAWAIDELLSLWFSNDHITIQNCIFAEALNDENYPKSSHGGILIGSGDIGAGCANYITIHHNFFAHINIYTPNLQGNQFAEFTNNFIYNYGNYSAQIENGKTLIGDQFGIIDFTNNYYLEGINSKKSLSLDFRADGNSKIYSKNNLIGIKFLTQSRDGNYFGVPLRFQSESKMCKYTSFPVTTKLFPDFVESLLNEVGAFPSDSMDLRVINDAKNGTGKIISSPTEVGGWPLLQNSNPKKDSDRDNLPDDWEIKNAFNPNQSNNLNEISVTGYTTIELYLNSLFHNK